MLNALIGIVLTGSALAAHQPTTISISSPTNNQVLFVEETQIKANAKAGHQLSITSVSFYVNSNLIGTDNSNPYQVNWSATAGSHSLTAVALDSSSVSTTSTVVNVVVNASIPSVSISNPGNGTYHEAGSDIEILADASDDGSVTQVEFFADTTSLGADNSSPYGLTWNSVTGGTYGLRAVATDDLGTTNASANVQIFVITNSLPSVTLTSPANGATFGEHANIDLSADATDPDGPVISVEFFHGSTSLGVSTSSPFTFSWVDVAAGTYSLTATAYDTLNASTASSPVNITVIGNAAPSVSLTTPSNGSTYLAPASVSLDADASDSDGSISDVEFFAGTSSLGIDSTSPYSMIWSNVAAGSYSLTAVATDDLSTTTASTAALITVIQNQLPVVSITSPSNGSTFGAPASIAVNADASDPDGSITSVEFFEGTTSLGTDSTSPYSVTWLDGAQGNYQLTAVATDNRSDTTTSSQVNVEVNQVTNVSITNPTEGEVLMAGDPTTIRANAKAGTGLTLTSVSFYANDNLIGTDNDKPYTVDWTPLVAGTNYLKAVALDSSTATVDSEIVHVIVNGAVPTVSITSPAIGATFTAPATVVIDADASDDSQVVQVEFFSGTTSLAVDSASPYGTTWESVVPGGYSLKAVATDDLGATTDSAVVTIDVGTNSPPSVTLTSPANGATFQAPASIVLSGDASDADDAISKVEFYEGATKIGTVNSSPFNMTWSSVVTGTYSITAKATDARGANTTSSEISITVVPNNSPSVTLTSPSNGASFEAPATINLAANASDSDGSVQSVEFLSGTTSLGVDSSSPYTASWTDVGVGTYSLTARATDSGGATADSTAAVVNVVVNSSPSVSMTTPANGATFAAASTIQLAADASDSDGTVQNVEFFSGSTSLAVDSASPYLHSWTNVTEGSYALTAVATDDDGATGTSSAVNISVVTNAPPTVTLTAPLNGASIQVGEDFELSADASDPDGTIESVEFFVGTSSIAEVIGSPYTTGWSLVVPGTYSLTAVATDNLGTSTTSDAASVTFEPINNGDFNLDGNVDILWRNTANGNNSVWMMQGTTFLSNSAIAPLPLNAGKVFGTADFNRDGQVDILWRNASAGTNFLWLLDDELIATDLGIQDETDKAWKILGTGDFNQDTKSDIVWKNANTGALRVWLMDGTDFLSSNTVNATIPAGWSITRFGDFNRDGHYDMLLRHNSSGRNRILYMDGLESLSTADIPTEANLAWKVAAVADFDGDANVDILWRNSATGANKIWLMNDSSRLSSVGIPARGLKWTITGPR